MTLCDLPMAAQITKELDLKLLLESGLQTGSVYYIMHFSAAKELFHIFLNLVGLCVIVVVTCRGGKHFSIL